MGAETSIEIKRWGNILPNGCMKQEDLRMFATLIDDPKLE